MYSGRTVSSLNYILTISNTLQESPGLGCKKYFVQADKEAV